MLKGDRFPCPKCGNILRGKTPQQGDGSCVTCGLSWKYRPNSQYLDYSVEPDKATWWIFNQSLGVIAGVGEPGQSPKLVP